ncbi:MAG: PPOX class F420-dependent oxidoreductase [Anaerolineales bacterium]
MSMKSIPEKFEVLFGKRSFGHLATLMPDGSPQVTPVWVDYDGQYVLVNSAEGRQKDLNMERDPQVAISIQDPDDPYRYVQVRGVVEEITTQGADEHIDKQAQKYLDVEEYPHRVPGEVRKLYKIKPEHV